MTRRLSRAAVGATMLLLLFAATAFAHTAASPSCETLTFASSPGFTVILTKDGVTLTVDATQPATVAPGTWHFQFVKPDGTNDKEGYGDVTVEPCASATPEVTPSTPPTPSATPTPSSPPSAVPSHPVPSHPTTTVPPSDADLAGAPVSLSSVPLLVILGLLFAIAIPILRPFLRRR